MHSPNRKPQAEDYPAQSDGLMLFFDDASSCAMPPGRWCQHAEELHPTVCWEGVGWTDYKWASKSCNNGSKSEWVQVIHGLPQGSVLGPLLFSVYINDLDSGISSDISKFADNMKIGRIIRSDSDAITLHADFDRLNERTDNGECSLILINVKYSV